MNEDKRKVIKKIIELREAGKTYQQIGLELKRPREWISVIYRKYHTNPDLIQDFDEEDSDE